MLDSWESNSLPVGFFANSDLANGGVLLRDARNLLVNYTLEPKAEGIQGCSMPTVELLLKAPPLSASGENEPHPLSLQFRVGGAPESLLRKGRHALGLQLGVSLGLTLSCVFPILQDRDYGP